uniref:Uncharacterized protein n=1 Tax=Janibacter limosus TaxID=53458 RepID=A0AC61U1L6_9MICO|nr:hypothetical protein [Janibacter limosus]
MLDRVDRPAMAEVRTHLIEMLREQHLETAPVFTVPETQLDAEGLIPEADIERLRGWLTALAGDQRAGTSIIRQTLRGALRSLDGRAQRLVEAAQSHREQTSSLSRAAYDAYDKAEEGVTAGMQDGQLLRGEVLARWQEFVGTGEFFRKVEKGVSRIRDRVTSAVSGGPAPSAELDEALHTGVSALLISEADTAAATVARTGGAPRPGPSSSRRTPASGARRASSSRPSSDWCVTGRTTSSTSCAPRAPTAGPTRAWPPTASTASASSSCSSRSPTPGESSSPRRWPSPVAPRPRRRRCSRRSSATGRCATWPRRPARSSSTGSRRSMRPSATGTPR